MYGGPAVPGGGGALNGDPYSDGTVSLWSNGRQAASTTTDAQGRFTVTLAPGTYGIESCGGAPPPVETVTVAGGQTTQHDISCQVP
jgi:hypothetical protein